MEGEEKQTTTEQQTILAHLSTAAFNALTATTSGTHIRRRELVLEAAELQHMIQHHQIQWMDKRAVEAAVYKTYVGDVAPDDIETAIAATLDKLTQIQSSPQRQEVSLLLMDPIVKAFKAPFVGDADVHFQNYLAACCSAYRGHTSEYKSPLVTITQSSGFGKSRILQRLAETTAQGNLLVHGDESFSTTVLYVCARDLEGSTGYPRATSTLSKWLFPKKGCTEDSILTALLRAFKYSVEHPDAAEQWQGLFDNGTGSKTFDDAVVETMKHVEIDSCHTAPRKSKKQRLLHSGQSESEPQLDVRATAPLVVVAIDEARTLLQIKDEGGVDALQMLQGALKEVNKLDMVTSANGSIFAVLVDTSPLVHKSVMASKLDPSARWSDVNAVSFPPYVLTHTMDVMVHDAVGPTSSRNRVLNTNPEQVWQALVSMGRPLWRSMEWSNNALQDNQKAMNVFAASKLLLGLNASSIASYIDSTLHGVSSLLCRVGLRPHASDPVATRLVADFMSVLHYTTYRNEAHISSYASDPVLTFGASRVWYQLDPPALESHVLRQFKTMLVNGVIDTDNIGEVVARIFLLLAMDATMMGIDVRQNAAAMEEFVFSGQFCTVSSFVQMLLSQRPAVRVDMAKASENQCSQCLDWMKRWEGWRVGFSHFVDLPEEPTDEVLWRLLDRRTAGVLSREQKGARLVIPIFSSDQASFILVQVKNQAAQDSEFPASTLANLEPKSVFNPKHPLHDVKCSEMIRLYMSLREVPDEDSRPAQFMLMSSSAPTESTDSPPISCTLCIRGMFAPNALDDTLARWPFLSMALAEQLRAIASVAWCDAKTQVEIDLGTRDDDEKALKPLSRVLPKHTATEISSKTLDLFSPFKSE